MPFAFIFPAALIASTGLAAGVPLLGWGPGEAAGVLANRTVGARPFDRVDPARPTVVVVHGLNPFHPVAHSEMAARYAEAYARRGLAVNVLAWEWDAASVRGLRRAVNDRAAVAQGHALAGALLGLGLDPGTFHLIGHSSGGVVAASAARDLLAATGRAVGRLTLIDPFWPQHPLIFEELGAATAAARVEHVWASGPSGFGRPAPDPGVRQVRFDGPGRWIGLVRPSRLDHLHAVRWHLATVGG